jgi:pyruvate,water dikinase
VGHREAVSFTYTYGYGLFRRYFLEIGRRLVERGVLGDPDDVMYLYLDEVRTALVDGGGGIGELAAARRAEIEAVRDLVMPEVIYGDDFIPVPAAPAGGTLRGIPSSRGHHRGTLRVVRDAADFPKVQPGDVIAIPYSDVGWTPLFARAGAVVAEAGGMLSHSSIVAREYRIPCVVSVDGATRIPDGATVTVDGYEGTVAVEDAP